MDQSQQTRPLAERVLLGIAMVAALGGMIAGAWWLWVQLGVGTPVRDSSPGWTPNGELVFVSETGGNADIYVTDRSGDQRRTLVATDGDDGGPAFSLDGSRLAYHSNKEGNYEIYVATADGGSQKRITHDPAIDQMPAWSRDGTHIVFMSNRGGKNFDIYRMKDDGTEVERLTTTGSNRFPEYSPDGGQLALQVDRDVYIMSLSSRGLRRVTHDPVDGMHPTWKPDGLQMAFASWRNGRGEIFTSQVDGNLAEPLVTMPTGDAIDPRWSPDGKFIAFVHVPGGGARDGQSATGQRIVYIVDVESHRLQRISR